MRGPRPTRAGVLLLAASVATAVAGRLLGLLELQVLAAAGLLAVALSLARLALVRPRLTVRRAVRPSRVHVGTPARVEVQVTSAGPRSTPVLTLVDPIGDRAGARLVLAPVRAGSTARAAYRLPTRRRGEVPVGPLRIEVTDPFGLARWARPATERVRLLVLPRIDAVPPLVRGGGTEPLAGHDGRPRGGRTGEEFHALRPYVVGDDLRRVHWPMSARADDLVVRHDDEPRQGRLTLALDVARDRSSVDAFERMVSAAASIAAAHWARGDIVRLVRGDGRDTGWVTGQVAFDHLLEVLALAERRDGSDLGRALTSTATGADTVVVVTGDLDRAEVAALPGRGASGSGRPGALTVIGFPGRRSARAPATEVVAGIRVITVAPSQEFAPAWTAAATRAGRAAVGAMP